MDNCKNCKTELTEMKNDKGEVTCTRCLKCYPITAYVPPAKKQRRDVDLPWTDERVIEIIDKVVPDMIRNILENWHIPQIAELPDTVDFSKDEDVDPDCPNWRAKAKELGIEVYDREKKRPRLKVDVLAEIAEKTKPSL